jgi:cyclase
MDFSKVEIKTIDLGHNTYRLEGQGGNLVVERRELPVQRSRPRSPRSRPIKYLINTHFHGDHTGGNEA